MSHLTRKLSDPEAAHELASRFFEFCLDQPLERYLDAREALDDFVQIAQSRIVERLLGAHLRPGFDREAARASAGDEKVEAYLTGETLAFLDELSARPLHLDPAFVQGLMRQEAVRELVRGVVVETVNRFLSSLKGDGGGVLGQLGRLGIGKGLMSKIGKQIEARLQSAAASFVQGSLDLTLKTLTVILGSPDMAAKLGGLGQAGFRAVMKLPVAYLWKVFLNLPVDDLLALVPGLLQHNLGREPVRRAIREEIGAALEVESGRTIREIVGDEDLVRHWRERFVETGGSLVDRFVRTEAFEVWMGDNNETA